MKAESTKHPERFIYGKNITLFYYNIKPVEREDMDGNLETIYKCDYVEIEGKVTRKKLIDSLIREKLDANDEFAKMALVKTTTEYKEYRQFIEDCKAIVDEAL